MFDVPAAQTADDPRAFRVDARAHERAIDTIALLLRATGAWPRSLARDVRDAAREREQLLEHFAGIARAGLAYSPTWQPSALLLRALAARGLSVADVLEAAR